MTVKNYRTRRPAPESDSHAAEEELEYSLEEILAEFGGGLEQKLTAGTEEEAEKPLPSASLPHAPEGDFPVLPEEEGETYVLLPVPESAGEDAPESESPAESDADAAPEPESPPEAAEEPPAKADAVDSILRAVLEADAETPSAVPVMNAFPAGTDGVTESVPRPASFSRNPDAVEPPPSVSLEEVVGNTVDAVMSERAAWPARRALFSRRLLRSREDLYGDFGPEEAEKPEVIGPEPDLRDAAETCRKEYQQRVQDLPAALAVALVPVLVLLGEWAGVRIPLLTGNLPLRALLLLGCLGVVGNFCRQVFTVGSQCTGAFLCGVSAVAAAADCATSLFLPGRAPAEPYAAAACLALVAAKWGVSLESRGLFDTFRTAALDNAPPYLVTDTEKGACKQRGAIPGFYTAALRKNFSATWQSLFLPVLLAATLVFAFLSSFGQDRGGDFLLNWSAILSAGTSVILPLCWGLPWARLARRLQKNGCAVAGWSGAERISRRKKMIVTDTDLFPPGSVQLNGIKIFNEDVTKAVSYAASMARASGCGLERVFDDLLRSELGQYLPVDNFRFYQEGGFSGVIRDAPVLLGTEHFLRRMGYRLPDDLHLPVGMFLIVEEDLIAAFALRYEATENVDFALRLMRRSRVTPILASRDPNITPALLKRKFHRTVKVEFPSLSTRVALSEIERDRDLPRGLLLREGLLPYAETVVGSRRICRGVRRATELALFGSAAGTLLAFYLVFQSRYNLLTPLNLILFLLLWTLPVLLSMELA